MKKIYHLLLTMMLAVFMASPAMANVLNNDDMAFAFGNSSVTSSYLGDMALLSGQEMVETEGGLDTFCNWCFPCFQVSKSCCWSSKILG